MASINGALVGVLVGVYLGINMLQVPDPHKVAALCAKYNISKIRLHEPSTMFLDAFIDTNQYFTLDIPNVLLKKMNDNSTVQNWFNTLVKPYIHGINFEYINVGEEGHSNILPTMKVLQSLFDANSLGRIKLTTIISYTSLTIKDLPSSGAFHPKIRNNVNDVINFLAQQDSPNLMVSLYPFKKYLYDNGGVISIDYATFGMSDSVRDGSYIYHNLFDAMVDTINVAIEKLRVTSTSNNVNLVIGETGWPTDGHGVDTNIALASKYNKKFIAHINSKKGTPRRPNVHMQGFIRSLFNEDARPEGESQYYGLFKSDYTPVYPLFDPVG